MRIYTRTGDDGETGLYLGDRVPKDEPRIEAYGTVDELSATLGLCSCHTADPTKRELIESFQSDLFEVGAALATADPEKQLDRITEETISKLETAIDQFEVDLSELKSFVLPGGGMGAAHFHVARVVCRRAERRVVSLMRTTKINKNVLPYLNRLSDLLFVLARHENHIAGIEDIPWQSSI